MTNEREMKIIEDSVRIIREKTDFEPEIGMILGSGLGDYADKIEDPVRISYHDIPDFPVSTVAGHAGQFVMGTCMGKKVIAMQGRVHYYEGYSQRLILLRRIQPETDHAADPYYETSGSEKNPSHQCGRRSKPRL